MSSEQLPFTFCCTYLTPSTREGCVAMSAETTSVGPTIPLVVEYCSCAWFVSKSSRFRSSMFVMSPTVTIANAPSRVYITSGWGSVSDITPTPMFPTKRPTSFSNFERNGAFWMLCIARWNPPGPSTAIPPR